MQIHPRSKIASVALAAVLCAVAVDVAANESVELTAGVIVDMEEGRIYLMSPERAVEAISVGTGEILWTNTNAAKPLAKSGNMLVSQAELAETPNVMDLVVLDTAQQGQILSSSSVALPSEVTAFIDESLTARFSSQAVTVDQEAFVSWEYQPFPRQGIVMAPDEKDPGLEIPVPPIAAPRSSTIKLDLATGEASTIEQQDMSPEAVEAFSPPAITAAPTDPTLRLSADGRHMLKYERVADDSEWNKYQWSIIDNDTGAEIGQYRSHLSQSTFLIVGSNTIIFESGAYLRRTGSEMKSEPRSIRAVNLATGEELWNRPLRDTVYRGAFPP